MKTKKIAIILLSIFLLIFTACSKAESGISDRNIQIQTEVKPVYNHFPTFPNTEKVEWYSISDEGIGLSTTNLYVFAYFDTSTEIDAFLESVSLSDTVSKIDAEYIPESVIKNETWQQVIELPFAFQDGVPKTKLMNTEVYINSSHTVIYMHAIGE